MKKLFLFLIFAVTFSYAQNLVEDNDITENRKEMGRQNISYDLNNPVEFYRLKCENPIYAQFPGGENGFKDVLLKNMNGYVDGGSYSVNGTFEVIIYLTKSGHFERFQLKPDVPNSNLLYRDLELALRKMNPKFSPATCNGIPIDSKIRQKINCRTDNFDI